MGYRYAIFNHPPRLKKVEAHLSSSTSSSASSSSPTWKVQELIVDDKQIRSAGLKAAGPKDVSGKGRNVSAVDENVTTELGAHLDFVERDEDENEPFTSRFDRGDDTTMMTGPDLEDDGEQVHDSLTADFLPAPSQLPTTLPHASTRSKRRKTSFQPINESTQFSTQSSNSSTIEIGLPPTLHFTLSTLTSFDQFRSLLSSAAPPSKLSTLCVILTMNEPKSFNGQNGQELTLIECSIADRTSLGSSMNVTLNLWGPSGIELGSKMRRGDVIYFSKMSLKSWQNRLQLSTSKDTQVQICWRSFVVSELDQAYRFHSYWRIDPKVDHVLSLVEAYDRFMGR